MTQPRRDAPWPLRIPKEWKPEIEAAVERREMTQHAFLLKTIRRVLDGEGAPSPPSTHTSGSTEVDRLERRLREVDYIVGNEDSLDSEACAALRAVIFDIPDPRRPAIPDPVEIDPADYASPPSTHTSDGSPESTETVGNRERSDSTHLVLLPPSSLAHWRVLLADMGMGGSSVHSDRSYVRQRSSI
jgi:hypothetical protein